MQIKKLDNSGWSLLIENEGIRLKPYLDTRGIPTIAMGNTYYTNKKRVTMKDKPLTMDQAMALAREIVKDYETTVWAVTRDDISQRQFNALVSLAYNIGIPAFKGSGVLKEVNSCPANEDKITAAFLQWTRAGLDKLILKPRRLKELKHYFNK